MLSLQLAFDAKNHSTGVPGQRLLRQSKKGVLNQVSSNFFLGQSFFVRVTFVKLFLIYASVNFTLKVKEIFFFQVSWKNFEFRRKSRGKLPNGTKLEPWHTARRSQHASDSHKIPFPSRFRKNAPHFLNKELPEAESPLKPEIGNFNGSVGLIHKTFIYIHVEVCMGSWSSPFLKQNGNGIESAGKSHDSHLLIILR